MNMLRCVCVTGRIVISGLRGYTVQADSLPRFRAFQARAFH